MKMVHLVLQLDNHNSKVTAARKYNPSIPILHITHNLNYETINNAIDLVKIDDERNILLEIILTETANKENFVRNFNSPLFSG